MTVSSTLNFVSFSGNGTTTAFPFASSFFLPSDLQVSLFNVTTQTVVTPAPVLGGGATYDYVVNGTLDPATSEYLAGGTVVFNNAPPGNYDVLINRAVSPTQQASYNNNNLFPAKVLEAGLDRLTMLVQELVYTISLTLTAPIGDAQAGFMQLPPASKRASQILGFNAQGQPVVIGLTTQPVPLASSAIDPAAAPFNADNTGLTDATTAFSLAIEAASLIGAEIVPSPGKYLFNGSINPTGVAIRAPFTFTRGTLTFEGPGVVFLHNGSIPLIQPTGGGWSIRGVVFYDPNQPGTGTTPVVRPPLIQPAGASGLVDFRFCDNFVQNCYDFLYLPANSTWGASNIEGNDIYAVRYCFHLQGQAPETNVISGNRFTPGAFENAAVFANGGMLGNWTSANGAVFWIDCAGLSVGALFCSGNLFYGYYFGVYVNSGIFDISNFSGCGWDGMVSVLTVAGSAQCTGFVLTGGYIYAEPPSTAVRAASGPDPVFFISTTGLVEVSITGVAMQFSLAQVVVLESTGVTEFHWSGGEIIGWGNGANVIGEQAALGLNNPNANATFRPDVVFAETGTLPAGVTLNGVDVTTAGIVLVSTRFIGLTLPVLIRPSTPAGMRLLLAGCMDSGTTGTLSTQVSSGAGGTFRQGGCMWQLTSQISDTA